MKSQLPAPFIMHIDNNALKAFLYALVRDEVTPGKIEWIMLNVVGKPLSTSIHEPGNFDLTNVKYSNSYVEKYVEDIMERLANGTLS